MNCKMLCRRIFEEGVICVEYDLLVESRNGQSVYSIRLTQREEAGSRECLLRDVARGEDKARYILSLLSDNGVTADTALFVMDDLAAQMTFY